MRERSPMPAPDATTSRIHSRADRGLPFAQRWRGGSRHRRRIGRLLQQAILPLVLLLMFSPALVAAQAPAPSDATADEQLAQKYAPIAYLKRQEFPCDPEGEPWLPAPVDIAFGDEAVHLRQYPEATDLKDAPTAADLFDADASHYLDLPGNPREPGCSYERHARERMRGREPTVYAHIATEEGAPGLALQYWFYYYFNDFNDKHESDWEMMQLTFNADSAAEALTQDPVSIAFSQHKGGETAAWDGDKLRKEDGHPVTYPARGSHGNYYREGIWLGWGENRSGLGCDNTTGPSVRVAPRVVLVPNEVAGASDPLAWSTFGGKWGQREAWVYDGPRGPNLNARWESPITWAEGLRDSSLRLDASDSLGPAPTSVFCATVQAGSDLFTQLKVYPAVVTSGLVVLFALAIWLVVLAAPILAAAWRVYTRHVGTFLRIGALIIPVGLLANLFHYLVVTNPPVEEVVGATEGAPLLSLLAGLIVGNLQHLASLIFVAPAVIEAVADIQQGRQPSVQRAYAAVMRDLRALLLAGVRAFIIVAALALTIVGLPWAIERAVRWSFISQAIVIDDASAANAPAISAGHMAGRWWRTAGTIAVLLFLAASLGPLIGIGLMVLGSAPLAFVNGVSGVIYAITHPFAVVGATLLYQRLRDQPVAPPASDRPARVRTHPAPASPA